MDSSSSPVNISSIVAPQTTSSRPSFELGDDNRFNDHDDGGNGYKSPDRDANDEFFHRIPSRFSRMSTSPSPENRYWNIAANDEGANLSSVSNSPVKSSTVAGTRRQSDHGTNRGLSSSSDDDSFHDSSEFIPPTNAQAPPQPQPQLQYPRPHVTAARTVQRPSSGVVLDPYESDALDQSLVFDADEYSRELPDDDFSNDYSHELSHELSHEYPHDLYPPSSPPGIRYGDSASESSFGGSFNHEFSPGPQNTASPITPFINNDDHSSDSGIDFRDSLREGIHNVPRIRSHLTYDSLSDFEPKKHSQQSRDSQSSGQISVIHSANPHLPHSYRVRKLGEVEIDEALEAKSISPNIETMRQSVTGIVPIYNAQNMSSTGFPYRNNLLPARLSQAQAQPQPKAMQPDIMAGKRAVRPVDLAVPAGPAGPDSLVSRNPFSAKTGLSSPFASRDDQISDTDSSPFGSRSASTVSVPLPKLTVVPPDSPSMHSQPSQPSALRSKVPDMSQARSEVHDMPPQVPMALPKMRTGMKTSTVPIAKRDTNSDTMKMLMARSQSKRKDMSRTLVAPGTALAATAAGLTSGAPSIRSATEVPVPPSPILYRVASSRPRAPTVPMAPALLHKPGVPLQPGMTEIGAPSFASLEKLKSEERADFDEYGRVMASPGMATFLVVVSLLFPPCWLLIGTGFFDDAVGTIPRRHKQASIVLGSVFLTIVIACIIIGLVLGTRH